MTGADGATKLYTAEILALAVDLADFPFEHGSPRAAELRSRSCGSVLSLSISTDRNERIERVGLRVSACAIGQAAAAIFAKNAPGRTQGEIEHTLSEFPTWLSDGSPAPDWPGVEALASARAFPARHQAILLPWRAASHALSKTDTDV